MGFAWYIGKRFLLIQLRPLQHLIRRNWIHGVPEQKKPLHSSTVEKSERQTQDQDQRCQSGPSAKSSVIFSEGDSFKNYEADQQRLQISGLQFDKFLTPATFACWKIRLKTEVCTCSQFPTEALHLIKEVELVDSVDELRSSSSTRGIPMPDFEVLDARIASALNKIIHNSHFKRRISLGCSQRSGQPQIGSCGGRVDPLAGSATRHGHHVGVSSAEPGQPITTARRESSLRGLGS